jgi:parvulin-like peptidyl-prolyl isomerase
MRAHLVVGTAVLAAAVGCLSDRTPPDAVAEVAERLVRWPELEAALRAEAAEETAALSSAVLSALLDSYIDEIVLDRYARMRGWTGEDATVGMLDAELQARPVSEEELRSAYAERSRAFDLPARLRLRQLLIEDRANADEAIRRLEAGEDFVDVSRRLSLDPNAERGGEQPGAFTTEELPPQFAEAILALEVGQISPILQAPHGFHIFQVIAKLPAEQVPFEQAKEELQETLRRERADGLLEELLTEARAAVRCRVFDYNLPFSYQGHYPTAEQHDRGGVQ